MWVLTSCTELVCMYVYVSAFTKASCTGHDPHILNLFHLMLHPTRYMRVHAHLYHVAHQVFSVFLSEGFYALIQWHQFDIPRPSVVVFSTSWMPSMLAADAGGTKIRCVMPPIPRPGIASATCSSDASKLVWLKCPLDAYASFHSPRKRGSAALGGRVWLWRLLKPALGSGGSSLDANVSMWRMTMSTSDRTSSPTGTWVSC